MEILSKTLGRFTSSYSQCTGTVTIISVTIPPRWRTAISGRSHCAGFWAMHWEMASLSDVLYGCVDNLHICLRKSNAVTHLTAKKAYFVLSAMVVTDSPGTRQMIVTALQGGRNCRMWIVTDCICQDWSNRNYWIRANQSLHQNAFQTSLMCSQCVLTCWFAL